SFMLFLVLQVTLWEVQKEGSGQPSRYFMEMLQVDRLSLWFNMLMAGSAWLFSLLFSRDMEKIGNHQGEYFALICFMLTGVFLLSGYQHLILLFLGMEIMYIPQYI